VSKIPHKVLPINLVVLQALELYRKHGGSIKLHYFDSFHVATSKHYGIPLITSDKYIINNSESIEVNVIDLRNIDHYIEISFQIIPLGIGLPLGYRRAQ